MSEAMSHIITFQSFEEVNTNREFRDQLFEDDKYSQNT